LGASGTCDRHFLVRLRIPTQYVNTVIYLASSVLSRAASILLIPIYTRRLTQAEYGTYGLVASLYLLVPPAITGGLVSAFGRFIFDEKDPSRRNPVIGSIASAMASLCAAFLILGYLALALVPAPAIFGLTPSQVRMVLWTCACLGITDIPTTYFRMTERAVAVAALNLSWFAATTGGTAYLMLHRNLGLTGLVGGMLIGQAAAAAFAILFILLRLRPTIDFGVLKRALHFSVPFVPHIVGNALMVSVDRWMLDIYGFREGLGLYALAVQLTSPIPLATSAWNEASSPRFLAAWRDGGDGAARAMLPRIVAGFLLAGGGTLIAVLCAIPLLSFAVGPRFRPAFALVPWVGVSLVVGALFSAYINVLFLRKTTRIIPVLTLSSVAVNALLNVVLVPRLGVYGAIAGTGAALAFRTAIMAAFARRALRPQQD
jgi:O-antigen/teichoic acid export membrane protein